MPPGSVRGITSIKLTESTLMFPRFLVDTRTRLLRVRIQSTAHGRWNAWFTVNRWASLAKMEFTGAAAPIETLSLHIASLIPVVALLFIRVAWLILLPGNGGALLCRTTAALGEWWH